jgi:hypothetical protein
VLETGGNSQQNLDRIFSGLALPVTAIEPGSKSQDDEDEGITQNADEKEEARY